MIEENSGVIEVFLVALKWIFDHQPFISFKGDLRNKMSLAGIYKCWCYNNSNDAR